MTELNIQIEELISKNATDFQISKVFKTYYKKTILTQLIQLLKQREEKIFLSNTQNTQTNF